jgi:hypothetical protein
VETDAFQRKMGMSNDSDKTTDKRDIGMVRKVKTVSLEQPFKEQRALVDASHDH